MICKTCKKNESTTDYGLCKSCDEWLLHTWKSNAGRKDLINAKKEIASHG